MLFQKILEAKDRQPLDVFPGIHLIMIDLIMKSTFGNNPGALDGWSENSHNVLLTAVEDYGRLILLVKAFVSCNVTAFSLVFLHRVESLRAG